MKTFSFDSEIGRKILPIIKKYNHKKYWRRRSIVVDPDNGVSVIIKLWWLLYIKRVDAYHGCSFGTNLNRGAKFGSPPSLPHGPTGIFVGHDVSIGSGAVIFQQVTVAHGGGTIGDNVLLGAGAKVLAGCRLGDNVRVGANCVVVDDVPSESTVVLHKPRVIFRHTAS
jgi:serine acetyltransferase